MNGIIQMIIYSTHVYLVSFKCCIGSCYIFKKYQRLINQNFSIISVCILNLDIVNKEGAMLNVYLTQI